MFHKCTRGMVVREGLDCFPGCTCFTCAPEGWLFVRDLTVFRGVHVSHVHQRDGCS